MLDSEALEANVSVGDVPGKVVVVVVVVVSTSCTVGAEAVAGALLGWLLITSAGLGSSMLRQSKDTAAERLWRCPFLCAGTDRLADLACRDMFGDRLPKTCGCSRRTSGVARVMVC